MTGLVGYVPLPDLARQLGRPVRIAMLRRRSKYDEDTMSMEVQDSAITAYLHSLPPGSYTCDPRLAEDGGDVYEQIVSAWRGDGKHKLLRRILADLSKYDVVTVHRLDRLGRNTLAVLTALSDMRDAGVRLFCVAQALDTADPSQQFTTGIYALLAQQSSDLSSARIKENKALAKQRGGWRGGAITYGYRRAMTIADGSTVAVRDKHGYKVLEPDPVKTATLTRVIDDIVDSGWSCAKTVRWLNEQNVASPRGSRRLHDGTSEPIAWTVTGLRRILTNPMLMGFDVVAGKAKRFEILEIDGRPHRPHPPLVADARWHELQQCLRSRQGSSRRAASEALLAGLVVCTARRLSGEPCGRPMYGPGTITSNSASYACRTSNNLADGDPQRCTGNAISARMLQRLAEVTVLGISNNPAWQRALQQAYSQARAAATNQATDVGDEFDRLQREMADLREEGRNAKSATRREQVARDLAERDTRLAELEEMAASSTDGGHIDVAVDFAGRWEAMSVPERGQLIRTLVERIEVSRAAGRGRGFDPSRVRLHLRNVGVLHITEPLEQPAGLPCPECTVEFGTPAALGVHRRHKHGVIGLTSRRGPGQRVEYLCPADGCGRRVTSAGGLRRHLTVQHGRREVFVCPHSCPKVFGTALDLGSHMRQAHVDSAGRTPVPCDTCGKVLRNDHGLLVHRGRAHPPAA